MRSRSTFFCSSVRILLLYGFFPNRNAYKLHSGHRHSLTSGELPVLQSKQCALIALKGLLIILVSSVMFLSLDVESMALSVGLL